MNVKDVGAKITGLFRVCINFVIRYRYLIALVVFALLVLFKVNGSSADLWRTVVPTDTKSSVVLGTNRPLRSDEWRVQTPYILAQSNGQAYYPVNNTTVTPSGENMIISYNVPVFDLSVLSKPFNWGFLLFGPEYGLAWYWNMKILLLLLLTFELCMVITRQNKLVSLLGAFWITFSPAIQWWFMQHVCDTVVYMEAIVVLFYYYLLNHDILYRKIIFAAGFALSCVGYALILYPAVQVPLGYLTLVFLILVCIGFSKKVKVNLADILIGVGALACMGFMLWHVFAVSKDAILATLNTAYPGKRSSSGAVATGYWFNGFLTNPFLPYKDAHFKYINNCEISGFINFLPAVLFSIPLIIKKKAQNLRYFIGLSAFSLVCILYMYVKVPAIIAKITMLSYTTHRIVIAYGVASVFLSIWAISELSRLKGSGRIYSAAASLVIALSYYATINYTDMKTFLPMKYFLALILVLFLINYCLMRGMKKTFSVLMCGLIAVSGLTVNPVNIGIGPINKSPSAAKVKSIAEKDRSAIWIANGEDSLGTFLYANGAKTVGGINFYPDMAKWKKLDPQGKDTFVYNRYAHISFLLSTEKTRFHLQGADAFEVRLNIDDLEKLDINYVFSRQDLSGLKNAQVRFDNVYPGENDGMHIYRVRYLKPAGMVS